MFPNHWLRPISLAINVKSLLNVFLFSFRQRVGSAISLDMVNLGTEKCTIEAEDTSVEPGVRIINNYSPKWR